MDQDRGALWYLSLFPYGVASGIIGTLIPLYLIQGLGASLLDLGTMTFASSALLIPASLLLGSLPDRFRASKPFILASLLGVSATLYLMSGATTVLVFQALFVAMELFGYLKGPSTSILIAEGYERSQRSGVIARQGFVEAAGGVTGLGVCILFVNALGYRSLLQLAAPLVFASFLLLLVTLRDSPLYIERSLDRLDRAVGSMEDLSIHLTGAGRLSPGLDGEWHFGRGADMRLFGLGRAVFAFAASNAFNTLSIFLLTRAGFSNSMVFTAFLVRSLSGAVSYLAASRLAGGGGEGSVKMGAVIRIALVSLLPCVVWLPAPWNLAAAALLLSLIAVSWSVYAVGVEVVTVMYAAPGSLGFFDSLTSIGGAVGNYTGGLIPTLYGFETLFMLSAGLFALALFIFTVALRK